MLHTIQYSISAPKQQNSVSSSSHISLEIYLIGQYHSRLAEPNQAWARTKTTSRHLRSQSICTCLVSGSHVLLVPLLRLSSTFIYFGQSHLTNCTHLISAIGNNRLRSLCNNSPIPDPIFSNQPIVSCTQQSEFRLQSGIDHNRRGIRSFLRNPAICEWLVHDSRVQQ